MLSLVELERAVGVLAEERTGARLERAIQRGSGELDLILSGGAGRDSGDRAVVVLSCDARLARLGARAKAGPAPAKPLPFAQYLQAHLVGARLAAATILDRDRQAALAFEGAEGRFELVLSILGPRSNVYLLDGERRLLLSLRPLAETRRDLAGGDPWSSPPSSPPPAAEDRFADASSEELLERIEAHYAERESDAATAVLRRRLARALKKQRDGLERKERRLAKDLEAAAAGEEARRLGELLKSVLSEVPARAASAQAVDPGTGEPVTIPLDPALGPAANLERYFKRAKKAVRQELRARTESGAVAERLEAAEALASALDATEDADLDAFAARPEVERLVQRYAPPAAPEPAAEKPRPWKLGSRELSTRLVPKRYRTSDGLEIWVGKNDEGNDLLSTRLARGRDLFFHLEGWPGSHVVLRVEGKDEPPQASLLEAAELAVHFSKQRNSPRASVHIAAIKDVSKPKGVKPGLVYVHRGRTVQLRRDPERLKRILEARLDG
jgi:predicted ribosome quality control (RQC) complex YloA/Tae2 family protein